MKKAYILIGLMVLLMILSACQSNSIQTQVPTEENPIVTTEAYPGPGGENPAGIVQPEQPVPGVSIYPDLNEGDELTLEQFWGMLQNGEVKDILTVDAPSIKVLVVDGRAFIVIEPKPGFVNETIELCGDPCKGVIIK